MKNTNQTQDPNAEMHCAQEGRRIVHTRQRAIGRELRRFFDGIAAEPVPDDFLELLKQVDAEATDSAPSPRKR